MKNIKDISEVFYYLSVGSFTIITAVVAAIWSYIKWNSNQKKIEIERSVAVDGNLSFEKNKLDKKRVIVTIVSHWNNKSPQIINIDKSKSLVDIYEISREEKEIRVKKNDLVLVERDFFLKGKREFILQPKTSFPISTHYLLDSKKTYLIISKLYKVSKEEFAWTLEKVITL